MRHDSIHPFASMPSRFSYVGFFLGIRRNVEEKPAAQQLICGQEIMADWTKYFGAELQTKDGKKPTAQVLSGKKVIGIYFSAHWVRNLES